MSVRQAEGPYSLSHQVSWIIDDFKMGKGWVRAGEVNEKINQQNLTKIILWCSPYRLIPECYFYYFLQKSSSRHLLHLPFIYFSFSFQLATSFFLIENFAGFSIFLFLLFSFSLNLQFYFFVMQNVLLSLIYPFGFRSSFSASFLFLLMLLLFLFVGQWGCWSGMEWGEGS